MLLTVLAFISVSLTCTMFAVRQPMLGFACALFWAITGAQAYALSTVPWGDIYFYMAFASLLGMTTFTALGAYGLREKRDTIADEEFEAGEGEYIDENQQNKKAEDSGEARPSERTLRLRKRAERRRSGS